MLSCHLKPAIGRVPIWKPRARPAPTGWTSRGCSGRSSGGLHEHHGVVTPIPISASEDGATGLVGWPLTPRRFIKRGIRVGCSERLAAGKHRDGRAARGASENTRRAAPETPHPRASARRGEGRQGYRSRDDGTPRLWSYIA